MKKNILFLCTFFPFFLLAQPSADSLRNYVWPLGYNFFTGQPDSLRRVWFDFRGDTIRIDSAIGKGLPIIYANGAICDETGKLLVYSNGCSVMDSAARLVPGAEVINRGGYHQELCESLGYGTRLNWV